MNKNYLKHLRKAVILSAFALLSTAGFSGTYEWMDCWPQSWKNDSIYGSSSMCKNYTKGLTWYASGYIYGILENGFNYTPDDPTTSTPWVADEEGTVEDYEGNVYKTLRFGDTWWLAENLRTKIVLDSTETDTTYMQKYVDWNGACDGGEENISEFLYTHANDDAVNDSVYGYLYSWGVGYATLYKKTHLLKDSGWVAPDTMDFYNLVRRFGLWDDIEASETEQSYETIWTVNNIPGIGLFIKSDRKTLWATGSPRADEIKYNASGLCFPPAGKMEGTHSGFGTIATIWTATAVHWTPNDGLGRRYFILTYKSNDMTSSTKGYSMARSLRLIKRIKRTKNEDGTYTATNNIAWCPGYIDGETDPTSTTTPAAITPATATNSKIWGIQGNIMVSTSEYNMQADIYTINGIKVKTVQLAPGTMQISVNPGLYIVRVNNTVKKVVTY